MCIVCVHKHLFHRKKIIKNPRFMHFKMPPAIVFLLIIKILLLIKKKYWVHFFKFRRVRVDYCEWKGGKKGERYQGDFQPYVENKLATLWLEKKKTKNSWVWIYLCYHLKIVDIGIISLVRHTMLNEYVLNFLNWSNVFVRSLGINK